MVTFPLLASIGRSPRPAFGTPLATNGRGAKPQGLCQYILRSVLILGARLSLVLCFNHGNRNAGKLLVNSVAALRRSLSLLEEVLETGGVCTLDHTETRLVAHVVCNFRFGRAVIEVKGRFSFYQTPRIKAVKRPDTGVHGQFLLCGALS